MQLVAPAQRQGCCGHINIFVWFFGYDRGQKSSMYVCLPYCLGVMMMMIAHTNQKIDDLQTTHVPITDDLPRLPGSKSIKFSPILETQLQGHPGKSLPGWCVPDNCRRYESRVSRLPIADVTHCITSLVAFYGYCFRAPFRANVWLRSPRSLPKSAGAVNHSGYKSDRMISLARFFFGSFW